MADPCGCYQSRCRVHPARGAIGGTARTARGLCEVEARKAHQGGMMLSPAERRAKINAVIRVSAGNFLEMYDFIIYGYYASYIAHTFFPAGNEFVSLISALIAYGAGFLVRPIGAVVIGGYMDR